MPSDRKNSYWLFSQYIYFLITGLVTLKLNISYFGTELFGHWLLLFSIWNFGTALDFGFSTAVIKYVAQFQDSGSEKLNKVISTTFIVFLVIGFLIFLVINFFLRSVYLSDVSPQNIEMFSKIFSLLGFIFLVKYFSLYMKSLFEGFSNFTFSSKINMVQSTLSLAAVIIVTHYDLDLINLAQFYLVIPFSILLFLFFSFKKKYPQVSFRIKSFDIVLLREIFGFSLSIQVTNIFSSLVDPLVKYLIGQLADISFISIYEIGRRVTLSISTLFWTTFKTILPKSAVLKTDEERKHFVQENCVRISQYGITYAGLFFGVLLVFIVLFIKFWFQIDEAIVMLVILALPETINSFGFSIYSFLTGIGKAFLLAIIQFINLLTVSVFLFISFYFFNNSLGLLGIYASVIFANILMLLYIRKKFGVSIIGYIKKSGFYKLVILNIFLLLVCFILITNKEYYLWSLAFVSVTSLMLFGKDLQKLILILYKDFRTLV